MYVMIGKCTDTQDIFTVLTVGYGTRHLGSPPFLRFLCFIQQSWKKKKGGGGQRLMSRDTLLEAMWCLNEQFRGKEVPPGENPSCREENSIFKHWDSRDVQESCFLVKSKWCCSCRKGLPACNLWPPLFNSMNKQIILRIYPISWSPTFVPVGSWPARHRNQLWLSKGATLF